MTVPELEFRLTDEDSVTDSTYTHSDRFFQSTDLADGLLHTLFLKVKQALILLASN